MAFKAFVVLLAVSAVTARIVTCYEEDHCGKPIPGTSRRTSYCVTAAPSNIPAFVKSVGAQPPTPESPEGLPPMDYWQCEGGNEVENMCPHYNDIVVSFDVSKNVDDALFAEYQKLFTGLEKLVKRTTDLGGHLISQSTPGKGALFYYFFSNKQTAISADAKAFKQFKSAKAVRDHYKLAEDVDLGLVLNPHVLWNNKDIFKPVTTAPLKKNLIWVSPSVPVDGSAPTKSFKNQKNIVRRLMTEENNFNPETQVTGLLASPTKLSAAQVQNNLVQYGLALPKSSDPSDFTTMHVTAKKFNAATAIESLIRSLCYVRLGSQPPTTAFFEEEESAFDEFASEL